MGHVGALITRSFSDELTTDERARLKEHLRACPECQVEYDRTARILRAAADREPTRGEMAAWQTGIMESLDATPAEAVPRRRPARAPGWLRPVLACCLVIIVAGAVLRSMKRASVESTTPSVQLRGGSDASVDSPLVQLEVFAIAQLRGRAPVIRPLDQTAEAALDEYLQFRYLSLDPTIRYLYILGVDGQRTTMDYYPRPGDHESIPIQQARAPRSVGRSIRLAQRHRVGSLRIVALFSREPLKRQHVHARVGELISRRDATSTAAALGPGVYSVIKQITLRPIAKP